jgi:hypothetical protein
MPFDEEEPGAGDMDGFRDLLTKKYEKGRYRMVQVYENLPENLTAFL